MIFKTVNSVCSISQNVKFQRFTLSGYKDIWIRKDEYVAKTHFPSPAKTNAVFSIRILITNLKVVIVVIVVIVIVVVVVVIVVIV